MIIKLIHFPESKNRAMIVEIDPFRFFGYRRFKNLRPVSEESTFSLFKSLSKTSTNRNIVFLSAIRGKILMP